MRALWIAAIGFICVATAPADKKDNSRFAPGPASSYSSKQTNGNVTIAAVPYDSEDRAREAFGKLKPYEHGVLPVLILIQNDTAQALRLDDMRIQYTGQDRSRIDPTPAADVRYLGSGVKPPRINQGSPIPPRLFKHKNPLDEWQIEGRAFSAKLVPPHDAVHGFFYFQATRRPGAEIYINGIEQAGTGKEIIYFEIPLDRSGLP